MPTIAERLTAAKSEKHLTDKDAGEACGVDTSTFGRWRRGKQPPDFDRLPQVAKFLSVPLEELERQWNDEKRSSDGLSERQGVAIADVVMDAVAELSGLVQEMRELRHATPPVPPSGRGRPQKAR